MESLKPTPAEMIALRPDLAGRLGSTPLAPAWRRWLSAVAMGSGAVMLAVGASDLAGSEEVASVLALAGAFAVIAGWVGRGGSISAETLRLATALLALERAGLIALEMRDKDLIAQPGAGDLPRFPPYSPEDTLWRGASLSVAAVVEAWLGDRSNDPHDRARRVMNTLASARGLDASTAVSDEEAAFLADLHTGAHRRGIARPLLRAVEDGLERARVPVERRSEYTAPEYYREAALDCLFPGGPREVVDAPQPRNGLPTPEPDAPLPNPGRHGCLAALVLLAAVSGVAVWFIDISAGYLRMSAGLVGAGSLVALLTGTIGRRRRHKWQTRGYLAFEEDAPQGWPGLWGVQNPNGGNRSSPAQDIILGAMLACAMAVITLVARETTLLLLPLNLLVLYMFMHPVRMTALSRGAKRRIVSADLGEPVEESAAAREAPPDLEQIAPEPLDVTRIKDVEHLIDIASPFAAIAPGAAHHILLLRVFGSESYFEIVDWMQDWTRVGQVVALEGPDTISDSRALEDALARGDLAPFLIESTEEVEETMHAWFAGPDRRYQYRTAQCTNAAWQAMVLALLSHVSLVLMDLSGFRAQHQGSRWELQKLVDRIPLERITLLVNENTDMDFLARLLAAVRAAVPSNSPNAGRTAAWQVLLIGGPPTHQPDESHWAWLRRIDRRLSRDALCGWLASNLAAMDSVG